MGIVVNCVAVLFCLAFLVGLVHAIVDVLHWNVKKWRVKYPPEKRGRVDFKGGFSILMTYWVAKDYAKIFNGEVVRLTPEQEKELEETGAVADLPFDSSIIQLRGSI